MTDFAERWVCYVIIRGEWDGDHEEMKLFYSLVLYQAGDFASL